MASEDGPRWRSGGACCDFSPYPRGEGGSARASILGALVSKRRASDSIGVLDLARDEVRDVSRATSDGVIRFRVYGQPRAQPKARALARHVGGGRVVGRMVNPTSAEAWKMAIAAAARASGVIPPEPLDGPLRLDLTFVFARPARLKRKKDPDHRLPHWGDPDRDNLDRAVLNTLVAVGLIIDDNRPCAGEIQKWFAAKNEPPSLEIALSRWTP